MKVLITNMTGFRNKGCEAMTKVIIAQIVKRFPNARFAIFTNDPAYDTLWAPSNVPISFYSSPTAATDMFVRLFRLIRRFANRPKSLAEPSRQIFVWPQVIISTGGDVFSSEYRGLWRHLVPIRYATRLGKPTILLGHSIGPFRTDEERKAFVRAMRRVALITVRESLSFKYVQDMNLRNTRVELTADPAFCLPSAGRETVEKLWNTYGLPCDCPVVGIAPSQGITHYVNVSYKDHCEILVNVINHITNKLGFHVVLIPHVLERYVNNDDRLICSQLYHDLGFPRNVSVIAMEHSAEEIKGIIGRCDLLIAERMHAAIAGLSQSVPTLVVGYSVKARGILMDIFGSEEAQRCLVSIHEVNKEVLKEHFEQLWERRKTIVSKLTQAMPLIKKRASYNFDLVEEIFRQEIK